MGSKQRIGIMGGTFDPIHLGHLILGEKSYEQLSLDKVWFMPAGNPPHKRNRDGLASDAQRVEMVRRAIASNPHFALSLREMHAEGYTYTYRTLEALREENPQEEYYFIIGADSLFSFATWVEPARICAACTLVVAARNQTPQEAIRKEMRRMQSLYGGNFLLLDTPNIDISSHELRKWRQEGRSLRYYVPDCVLAFLEQERIYNGCL